MRKVLPVPSRLQIQRQVSIGLSRSCNQTQHGMAHESSSQVSSAIKTLHCLLFFFFSLSGTKICCPTLPLFGPLENHIKSLTVTSDVEEKKMGKTFASHLLLNSTVLVNGCCSTVQVASHRLFKRIFNDKATSSVSNYSSFDFFFKFDHSFY